MHRVALLSAALAAIALAVPSQAGAAAYVPGEVLVKYKDGTSGTVKQNVEAATGTDREGAVPGGSRQLSIEDGASVKETVAELRKDPNVEYAVPNYVARASAFMPNDQGFYLQWNLSGPFGINMPDAWDIARARGVPGGKGAVVAVLDTGVAYERYRRFRRAPDLNRFVRGYVGGQLFGKELKTQQFQFVRGNSDPPGPGSNFAGLAIFKYNTNCGTIFGHTGSFPGYTQFIAAKRNGQASVTVSANEQIRPDEPAVYGALVKAERHAVCAALTRGR
jgi:hypothetical protein